MRSLIFFLLLLTGCANYQNAQRPDLSKLETYKVTRVVDGDTFWVDDGSEKGIKIRLLGVDAPELRASRYKEKGAYAEEASEFLEELIVSNIKLFETNIIVTRLYEFLTIFILPAPGYFGKQVG